MRTNFCNSFVYVARNIADVTALYVNLLMQVFVKRVFNTRPWFYLIIKILIDFIIYIKMD